MIGIVGPPGRQLSHPVVLTGAIRLSRLSRPPPVEKTSPTSESRNSDPPVQSDLGAENQNAAIAAAWLNQLSSLLPRVNRNPPALPPRGQKSFSHAKGSSSGASIAGHPRCAGKALSVSSAIIHLAK